MRAADIQGQPDCLLSASGFARAFLAGPRGGNGNSNGGAEEEEAEVVWWEKSGLGQRRRLAAGDPCVAVPSSSSSSQRCRRSSQLRGGDEEGGCAAADENYQDLLTLGMPRHMRRDRRREQQMAGQRAHASEQSGRALGAGGQQLWPIAYTRLPWGLWVEKNKEYAHWFLAPVCLGGSGQKQ